MAKNVMNNTINVNKKDVNERGSLEVMEINPDKRVKVRLRVDYRAYLGNRWYEFKAGDEPTVPQGVKDILQVQGALDVI